MIIAALNEGPKETRVALAPSAIKALNKLGFTVVCETNAGLAAGFSDEAYREEGAIVIADHNTLLHNVNIIASVNEPNLAMCAQLPEKALIIGQIADNPESEFLKWCCKHHISVFSMSLIPHLSRTQGMNSLTSQASLAGYRAVLEAANYYHRVLPLMMTAAGRINPAQVVVLGADVAGLQAISTAKRLGAIVYAFDAHEDVREQVESLGAEFITLDTEEEMVPHLSRADIVISTVFTPGNKAPCLIRKAMVEQMKAGSVIVDLAISQGGNCELTRLDEVLEFNLVTIIGHGNFARLVPASASELYSGNIIHLLRFLAAAPSSLIFNPNDEILKHAMLCHNGLYLPFKKRKKG